MSGAGHEQANALRGKIVRIKDSRGQPGRSPDLIFDGWVARGSRARHRLRISIRAGTAVRMQSDCRDHARGERGTGEPRIDA
jgi:hypothetical protein